MTKYQGLIFWLNFSKEVFLLFQINSVGWVSLWYFGHFCMMEYATIDVRYQEVTEIQGKYISDWIQGVTILGISATWH